MPEQRKKPVGRLRVTHVVLSLDVGGLERNVVNQARLAAETAEEVSILCVERRGTLADRAESLGARVICVHKRPGLRVSVVCDIRAALRQLQPHVVHTHQIGPLFYTGLAAIGLKIPLIVHTEHGKVNYRRLRTRWLGRLAGKSVKAFYCLSQDMADAVAAAGIVPRRKLRVIRNGIDTAFYAQRRDTAPIRRQLTIPLDAPLIGTVGRLNEIKRQDVLIDAFEIVVKNMPEAHLLLVGDGPQYGALQEQAQRLRLADRVHFAGYQADTTAYLHAMDVFTLTSRSEGMPQALLEACVARKPVVATRVGGIPEVIEHGTTGMLVDPADAEGLAASLLEVLRDRPRAEAMARCASEKVINEFDVARMAREYHRDFLELLHPDALSPAEISTHSALATS
jgi:glycosyltransferase involved in cell wall biosynthesis